MQRSRVIGTVLVAALVTLVSVGVWQRSLERAAQRIAVVRYPKRVMGTDCALEAVIHYRQKAKAEAALREAETVLRSAEARMSSWLDDSEISHFNKAPAGKELPLSADTLAVLRVARQAAEETGRAFDVTCRPLLELWQRAAQVQRLPSRHKLAEARAASNWSQIKLTHHGAIKRNARASVNLGGIAKGFAIDRALEILLLAGFEGGLVDVGGDLCCFGRPPTGETWLVDVRNPFDDGRLLKLRLPGGAVCTSGNYARFVEIDGRHYSHILDPTTGRPADAVPSVTVYASRATTADVWATALSVLGSKGFERLPEGCEALLVLGTKDHYRLLCTLGFRKLLAAPLPRELSISDRAGPPQSPSEQAGRDARKTQYRDTPTP